MPEGLSPEEFKAAKQVVKEVDEEIKKEEEGRPPELLTQKHPFSPASENEQRIKELEEIIMELKGHLLERIEKVEKEVENLKEENEDLQEENGKLKEKIKVLEMPYTEAVEELGKELGKELKKEADKKS
jgi:chromosome segregation ATPase